MNMTQNVELVCIDHYFQIHFDSRPFEGVISTSGCKAVCNLCFYNVQLLRPLAFQLVIWEPCPVRFDVLDF